VAIIMGSTQPIHAADIMPDLREQYHPDCIVCGPNCPHGMKIRLALDDHGVAVGNLDCDPRYEGYSGIMHGGIISALLDGAMTNCLFLHGRDAVTAQLVINFRHPVRLNVPAQVRACVDHRGESSGVPIAGPAYAEWCG